MKAFIWMIDETHERWHFLASPFKTMCGKRPPRDRPEFDATPGMLDDLEPEYRCVKCQRMAKKIPA